ncbi:hypothetical protein GCM10008985_02980 [Halococcus dombrowskii]|uniref:Transposase n=1 Tax=Halococcus dombrowskii TaxID=179637 RepID=A0AAV3SCA4_HALDO
MVKCHRRNSLTRLHSEFVERMCELIDSRSRLAVRVAVTVSIRLLGNYLPVGKETYGAVQQFAERELNVHHSRGEL